MAQESKINTDPAGQCWGIELFEDPKFAKPFVCAKYACICVYIFYVLYL